MSADSASAVEISNVTKTFKDFVALDRVDMHADPGEIVGILGPNGAGKTTLLRLCEGRDNFDSGRICFFGRDLAVEPEAVKGKLGLVLQRPSFSGYATVQEVIDLFASLNKPRVDPKVLAQKLGLEEKADIRIAKLSGGQRQRLGVLIGLMWGGGLLLLDEPTSELDPQARRVVWELIRIIARECNSSVLMTTHQMDEAENVCDRVYILDHGKVVAHGSPSQIIVQHCKDVAMYFSVEESQADSIRDVVGDFDVSRHGQVLKCRKLVKSIDEGREQIKTILKQAPVEVLEVGLQRSTLEDVFIQLTGSQLRG